MNAFDSRIDQLATAFVAAGAKFDWCISQEDAAALIAERVRSIAAQMRVQPRTALIYVTEESVTGMAQDSALTAMDGGLAGERSLTPMVVTAGLAGRLVADIAQAMRLFAMNTSRIDHTNMAADALKVIGDGIANDGGIAEHGLRLARTVLSFAANCIVADGWQLDLDAPAEVRDEVLRAIAASMARCVLELDDILP